MAIIDIPLGPSAFLSQNGANLNFDGDTAQICIITPSVQGGFITHLGITYSGNPNCSNQQPCPSQPAPNQPDPNYQPNWPFYFSLQFADESVSPYIYLNKQGILDIQGVQITKAWIHKNNISGNNSLGFEPSKLNIEFEWKKA